MPGSGAWDGKARDLDGSPPRSSPWHVSRQVAPTDEVPFAARFGSASSRCHDLAIKLAPAGFEQSVRIHLLAPPGQEGWSVPDVLAWNTALRRLEWTNHQGLVGLAEHLDVATALSSAGLLGLEAVATGIIEILSALASPGFILIGSVGFIVMALAAYYVLLFTVAKLLLLYVCLPSLGLAAVCGVVKQLRLQRFEEAVLAAARRAIQHLFDQEGRPC